MRTVVLLLFTASFAFGQTTVPSSSDGEASPLLQMNKWGGVQSVRLFLQSSSNGPMSFSYGGEPYLTESTLLLSYLDDKNIAAELMLTKEQQESVGKLLREYSEVSGKLHKKIESDDESLDELQEWIANQGRHFDEKLKLILLPHQERILAKIQVNYLVAAFGFSHVARFANQNKLTDISLDTLRMIERRERELVPGLRQRCNEFSQAQLKRLMDILDEEQKQAFRTMVAETQIEIYPELLSAQADLATGEREKPGVQLDEKLVEWGLTVSWVVRYSGSLEPRFSILRGYELDYLVNALAKDQRLLNDVDILDYQLDSIRLICDGIQLRNEELAGRLTEVSLENEKLIDAWAREKRDYVVGELEKVLLPHQQKALQDETQLMRLRKLGVVAYLADETTSEYLGLRKGQVVEIREVAVTIPENYLEFSKTTIEWSIEQVLQDVELESRERDELFDLFDSSYRIVSMPVGCLAETLARRYGR